MAPFIFWNLAFYTIIRTQLKDIILKTVLNDNVTYIPNSMTGTLPNGTTGALDDSWWSGQFWPLICLI